MARRVRHALHIVIKTAQHPFLEIVAGPNGSGKTTFAQAYLVREMKRDNYLNPDVIAAGVSPNYSRESSFQAGRIFLTEIKKRIKARESFGFETTLSGHTYLKILKTAKELGYNITIYFLLTAGPSTNIDRIRRRVRMGGHDIPVEDVRRRFGRSTLNFWSEYKLLADNWMVFDNSVSIPKLVIDRNTFEGLSVVQAKRFGQRFVEGKL